MKVEKAAPSTSAETYWPLSYGIISCCLWTASSCGELLHHRIDLQSSPVCPSAATWAVNSVLEKDTWLVMHCKSLLIRMAVTYLLVNVKQPSLVLFLIGLDNIGKWRYCLKYLFSNYTNYIKCSKVWNITNFIEWCVRLPNSCAPELQFLSKYSIFLFKSS